MLNMTTNFIMAYKDNVQTMYNVEGEVKVPGLRFHNTSPKVNVIAGVPQVSSKPDLAFPVNPHMVHAIGWQELLLRCTERYVLCDTNVFFGISCHNL